MAAHTVHGMPFVTATPSLHRHPPLLPRPSTGVNVPLVQRSAAVVPRTAEEWNVHRDLITQLYQDRELPLRQVQKIMETEYKFKATKRMYTTRLKQWNICKNYRAEEKELLAARIAQAHLENRSLDTITFKDKPVKFHRVLRHSRATARKRRGAEIEPSRKRRRVLESAEESSDSSSSGESPGQMVRVPGPWENTTHRTSEFVSSSNRMALVTPVSGYSSSTILTPSGGSSSDNEAVQPTTYPPSRDDRVLSPSPPLFPAKGAMNVELILEQTKIYYSAQLDTIRLQTAEIHDAADLSSLFWSNVKLAIYFLKTKTPSLAWPLLNEACRFAGSMLTNAPILFLNSVFTVLSPVNTRVCPVVRSIILRYLSQLATIRLTPRHPLSILFREISQEDDSGLASETALNLTLDMLINSLGGDHSATFTVRRSLIALLRRDKRLQEARQYSELLVKVAEQTLVSQVSQAELAIPIHQKKPTSISMTDLCMAMTELVHIHIDMKEYSVARGICSSVIQKYNIVQGVNFPDSRAAYAMEDMAEICGHLNDFQGATYWLRRAFDASCMLRGEGDAATKHVKDKLDGMMVMVMVMEPGVDAVDMEMSMDMLDMEMGYYVG
ncbi:hypothetical protein PV05_03366 [Exophiala xenobiotica]|uniref:Clr5 domain-containing protein n=1 Tax=Exophiala xenobiotica TaxID=348802 RepID=A0A0D2ET06_9EURO|nr:uncharacterized protein PV05_03366 [Exophiala xenobiotica]KIW58873.1 hypothetical protein PV05_03366 [Exophiala xenobiotica]